jgi:hypothetical protein
MLSRSDISCPLTANMAHVACRSRSCLYFSFQVPPPLLQLPVSATAAVAAHPGFAAPCAAEGLTCIVWASVSSMLVSAVEAELVKCDNSVVLGSSHTEAAAVNHCWVGFSETPDAPDAPALLAGSCVLDAGARGTAARTLRHACIVIIKELDGVFKIAFL